MRSNIKSIFLLLASLCIIFPGKAQNTGTIAGIVVDATNNSPLPGAVIQFEQTGNTVTTDRMGKFIITQVPRKDQSLTAHYLGYATRTVNVDWQQNDHLNLTIKLHPKATLLNGVEVKGRALGQAKAMLAQKNADNIVRIVSAEQITSFPDLSAGDAMQRMVGITLQRDHGEGRFVQLRGTPPEFTNFNVNGIQIPSPEGDVRYVGMDVINAGQIGAIEVTKVLRPDMNGDGIGGNVNIITKRAEDSVLSIKSTVAGGWNALRNTPNANAMFALDQRIGNFGFIINGNYNYNHQGTDNIEFNYEKNTFFGDTGRGNYHVQYREVQLRYYDIQRERIGLSTTLDYRLGNHTEFYLMGMFNQFSDDETRYRKVYTLDDALSERFYLYGGIEHDVKDRKKTQSISTLNIGGKHQFALWSIDYEAAWGSARENEPNRMEAIFENPGQAIAIKFDLSDPTYPKATFPQTDNPNNAENFATYELSKLMFERNKTHDKNFTARLNLQRNFTIARGHGYFKTGLLFRWKDKVRNIENQSFGAYTPQSSLYPLQGPPLSLTTVGTGFEEANLLQQGYLINYMPDPALMRNFYERYPTLFVYGDAGITETLERSFGEDYTASEDVYAGYAMIHHEVGQLTTLAGVRYEQTDINYRGYFITKRPSGYFLSMDTINDQRQKVFWLPNIQFKYALSPSTNLRAALSYSYVRPNFSDIIPYRRVDQRQEVRYGNPNLEYPYAMNIDVMYEHYWGRASIFSVGLYYKNIENFIFNYEIFGREGDPSQGNFEKIQLQVPLNGNRAFVAGAEVQAQFFMDFLPGIWRYLGLFTNYTFTYSEAYINQRFPANVHSNIFTFQGDYLQYFKAGQQEVIPLPGQSPHAANLAVFYDDQRLYLKLSANYQHDFLSQLGVDADLDEYYDALLRLDFNGYYAITPNFKIFGDVRNITNAPLRYYLAYQNQTLQQEYYAYWVRLGVRYNL